MNVNTKTQREQDCKPTCTFGIVQSASESRPRRKLHTKPCLYRLLDLVSTVSQYLRQRSEDVVHEMLPHLRYSSNLAPWDYHIFGPVKEVLYVSQFRSDDQIQQAVHMLLRGQPNNFFAYWIQKLIERYQKYIVVREAYVSFLFLCGN
ncbi:hypothetical protein AVEN_242605-1 [Araneus ventricosus]|uniref:Uncharacterized protein n=1 Tax=Araneus ventricosus TaxID=182803 RepID=A0A4Y2EPK5_ARAVE|nr:hypothetical protein AVEN_242605-1 [Araneus ventricosus]